MRVLGKLIMGARSLADALYVNVVVGDVHLLGRCRYVCRQMSMWCLQSHVSPTWDDPTTLSGQSTRHCQGEGLNFGPRWCGAMQ
jgi:hypothetical protein